MPAPCTCFAALFLNPAALGWSFYFVPVNCPHRPDSHRAQLKGQEERTSRDTHGGTHWLTPVPAQIYESFRASFTPRNAANIQHLKKSQKYYSNWKQNICFCCLLICFQQMREMQHELRCSGSHWLRNLLFISLCHSFFICTMG